MRVESISGTKIKRSVKVSIVDRLARKQVHKWLRQLSEGRLSVEENGTVYQFGKSTGVVGVSAHVVIDHPSVYRDILLGGSIGAGEAYMAGNWCSPNLSDLIRLMAANINHLNGLDSGRFWIQRMADRIYHWFKHNSEANAKRNISSHYDLSNTFFSLFLDSTMMYSAAVFPQENASLESAALHKLDIVCQRLQLRASDHLLEIGTGWGGLAVYVAKYYECKVTTTTISRQQYDYTCEKVKREGLENRIEVLLQDYRNLDGRFDKLVSIEMIEAVGHRYYERYFSTCDKLLKPGGLMFLQAITIPDNRYEYARKSVDFIQRYIFPGGSLPSEAIIDACIRRYTGLRIESMQEIGADYANTLYLWRQRFKANISQIKALGFDDAFIRMWEFYLSYCEGGFRERVLGTAQYVFEKPTPSR